MAKKIGGRLGLPPIVNPLVRGLLSNGCVNSCSVNGVGVNSVGVSNLYYSSRICGSLFSSLVSVTTTCYEHCSYSEHKCNLFHFFAF